MSGAVIPFPEDHPFANSPVVRVSEKDAPLLLFVYNGKTYATNLFKMHDQEGFPLAMSLIECRNRGWIPCVEQFRADAIKSGWTRERAERVMREGVIDSQ